jgi:hypothetical protein
MVRKAYSGPGRHAPALLLLAALLSGTPLSAQQPAPPPVSSVPVPDPMELSKLVWSTMAAIDHANRSGNYSVLRDLGAPGFQINNDAAQLAQIFSAIRSQDIDLSNTLLLAPGYRAPPAIVSPGVMRLQGSFGLRPIAIGFDLYYQWVGGRWKLFGVSITPIKLAEVQPGPVAQPKKK